MNYEGRAHAGTSTREIYKQRKFPEARKPTKTLMLQGRDAQLLSPPAYKSFEAV